RPSRLSCLEFWVQPQTRRRPYGCYDGGRGSRKGRVRSGVRESRRTSFDRQRLTRRQFERLLNGVVVDTEIIMESCGTAHYWGRRAQARGVRVRLLPVQYVRSYVRRNKTDRTDSEALLEAARCAEIHPVPVKTVEQ